MNSTNIVLIGFMGSGKSTLSKILYKQSKRLILDSDKIIQNNENLNINEIFVTKGEQYFRELEKEFCKFCSQNIQNCIIATGGGMPIVCDVKTMGKVFYLDLEFEEILKRLNQKEIEKRPLFSNIDKAYKLYLERKKIYKKSAEITLDGTDSLENLSKAVLNSL
ncbi:shikimate kinase [Helicobacter burdigaliensis]|uniref:shikimate kinase n=1 Tax=Helicobacter burdigaliensis TaxID=2315334 RepID=UPI000EF71A43|nr:shikimate kinase [Helicobacter burdigaliensis]